MRLWIGFLIVKSCFALASLFSSEASCDPNCPADPKEIFFGKMRMHALLKLDKLFKWTTKEHLKKYILIDPLDAVELQSPTPALRVFEERYGYLSPYHPLVGRVSHDFCDISYITCLMKTFTEDTPSSQFALAEMFTKALAYRDLHIGLKIAIPIAGQLEMYRVDHVFDLWHKMPAFGLVPDRPHIPAILLFRGTDFSLWKERGWASLLSDLDFGGPGVSVFMQARPEIHRWLQAVADQDKKAIVMGFSLGGVLAAYTLIYEHPLLSDQPSYSFNAPGISSEVLEEIPDEIERRLISYVYRGDVVSKVGKLFGKVMEVSTGDMMKPIQAHTILMSAQERFTLAEVDVHKENARRSR